MKKILLALPLLSSLAFAQGHEARIGFCFNTTNGWIPIAVGVSAATITPTPEAINIFGQNAGTAYALACDTSGNLALSGGTLSGAIGLPDGSAAAPAIFDNNNPTQGWYWRANSVIEYSQNNFPVIQIASNHLNVGNTGGSFSSYIGFVQGSVAATSPNASLLNVASGVLCTSTDQTTCTGAFQTGSLSAKGTTSVSGCSLTAAVGGAWAGSFHSGTTGTCTVTITPGITATNGFACYSNDLTTVADVLHQTSASTTTTAVISGTTASGDVVNWGCVAY